MVITIVVLVILSTVGISQGINVIRETKVNEFVGKLQIIQYKVNNLYEKGEDAYNNLGIEINSSTENYSQIITALNEVHGTSDTTGYKYFSKENLNTIGIEDVDIPVIINFSTRDVIGIEGVKKRGTFYYRLQELKEGYNVEYTEPEIVSPEFSITKKINGLNGTISIVNLKYKGAAKKGKIYYGEVTNANTNPLTVKYCQETG